MARLGRHDSTSTRTDDLRVVHHTIPDTAAGAGAAPIEPAAEGEGVTWHGMLRGVAVAQAAGLAILLVAAMAHGVAFFPPIAVAVVLYAVAAAWLGRRTKAGTTYTLVVSALTLAMFGGMFYGWTGFFYPRSWFEMSWATLTVLGPLAGVVAGVATLRRRTGANAARVPAIATGALAAAVVVTGLVGTAITSGATRLPGDVVLTASNLVFEQEALTARAGDVAIYLDNRDPFVHDVRIDGLGTSPTANGGSSIRHVFRDVPAGRYAFHCSIHTDMTGTLTVT